jgi:hypothetical protein
MSGPRAPKAKKKKKKSKRATTHRAPPDEGVATVFQAVSARSSRRKKKRRRVIAWTPNKATLIILFVIGAGTLGFIRYAGVSSGLISSDSLAKFQMLGVLALGVMYVAVTVDAFSDSVMHGMLSLFIAPFYGIYYLFAVCDSFLLRLLISILLVPFGLDMFVVMAKMGMGLLKTLGADWN